MRAIQPIENKSLDMFTSIGLGVTVAFRYGAAAALVPGAFPHSFRHGPGEVAVYFEAAAVIVTLFLVGQVLGLGARRRTGATLKELLRLAPNSARRVGDDSSESDVPLDAIAVGDRPRVRPGEKVPVGSVVLDGRSESPWAPGPTSPWRVRG